MIPSCKRRLLTTRGDGTYRVAGDDRPRKGASGEDSIAGEAIRSDDSVDNVQATLGTERSRRTLGDGGEDDEGNTDE